MVVKEEKDSESGEGVFGGCSTVRVVYVKGGETGWGIKERMSEKECEKEGVSVQGDYYVQ